MAFKVCHANFLDKDKHRMKDFDVIIIGGGPGGYVSAIRCRQLGLSVALIEKEALGGTCLNWGCIPTKSLLRNAEVVEEVKHAEFFGVEDLNNSYSINYESAYKRSRQVSAKLVKGIEFLMKKNGVTVFYDRAIIINKNTVELELQGLIIHCRNLVIAAGAKAVGIPDIEVDGKVILLPKDALSINEIPRKAAIIGAGAIGMEFASIWNTYGSEVTIFEWFDRILPKEDHDVSAEIEKAIHKQGIQTMTGTRIVALDKVVDGISLTAEKAGGDLSVHEFDTVLFAMGIKPNTKGYGIEKLGLELENGFIRVNDKMETNLPNVYAIGDITGKFPLAHVASAQGIVAAEAVSGLEPAPVNYKQVPKCTYCRPEAASIGLTEKEAIAMGKVVKTGSFPFSANGKALSLNENSGFIKMVSDGKSGEVLGVHMVGSHVTEMISGISVAMKLEATVDEFVSSIHPHPTLSEAILEAAHGTLGHSIHI